MKHTLIAFTIALSLILTPLQGIHAATPVTDNTALIQKLLAQVVVLRAELAKLIAQQGGTPSCTFTRLLKQGAQGTDVTCLQNFLKSKGHFSGTATGYFGPLTRESVAKWQRAEGIVAEAWEYGNFGEQSRIVYTKSIATLPRTPVPTTPVPVVPTTPIVTDAAAPTTPGTPVASLIADTAVTLTWASSTDNKSVYRYRVYKGTRQIGVTKTTMFTAIGLAPDTLHIFSVVAYDRDGNLSPKSGEVGVRTLVADARPVAATSTVPASVTPAAYIPPSITPYNPTQILFPATIVPGNATTFYVDGVGGNDANQGTSQTTAWKTLAKVSSVSLPPGSNVLFKKGQTFYGALVVNKGGTAGNPITFGAYGSGAKPVISGFYTPTNWTSFGNNIWESTDPVSSLATATVVFVGGEDTPMGRYPNEGYFPYESFSGKTSITSSKLSGGVNWTGAEVAAKKQRWIIDRYPVISQSGTTLTFPTAYYEGREGWGFFIQNDPRTLDQKDEWYFNPQTKKIRIYSRTKPTDVKVSSVDNIVTIWNKPHVSINGLVFEGGNNAAIFLNTAPDVSIMNSDIRYSQNGVLGLGANSSANLKIEKSTIEDIHDNGISLHTGFTNAIIRDNTVQDIGLIPGMGGISTAAYIGIIARGAGTLIDHNIIRNTGYDGITFGADNTVVSNNFISDFCILKDDGAGIYTNADSKPPRIGQRVINNIIVNGIGNRDGIKGGGASEAEGIYLDESISNMEVSGNSIAHIGHTGIYLHNNIGNITVKNNTVYDANIGFWIKNDGKHGNLSVLRNLTATDNLFFSKEVSQVPLHVATVFNDIRDMGVIDRNYYIRPDDAQFAVGQLLEERTAYYALTDWQTYSGFDKASVVQTPPLSSYQYSGVTGSNLASNGQFETDKSKVTVWSPTTNTTLEWDATSQVTGSGSLKVVPGTSKTDFALITVTGDATVPIDSGKNYVLRFKTRGTTDAGTVRVLLRKMTAPYTVLTTRLNATFGTALKAHEFFFTAPVSESAATFVIEFRESSGVTYIDDIELYETSAVAERSFLPRFEYNASDSSKTVSLDGTYVDVKGNSYTGTATIAPWSSVVLYKKPGVLSRLSSKVPLTTAQTQTTLKDLLKELKVLQEALKKLKK